MGYQVMITYHVEEHGERPAATIYGEILAHAALADELGVDGVWLAEHHFGAQQGFAPQPLVLAQAIAACTCRVAVGTSLVVLPLHHPLAVAEQLTMLDTLTGGRLSIGFGSGSAPFEFAGFGISFASPERHRRFREGLALLELAWRGVPFSFAGEFYQVPEARLVPPPARPLQDFAWLGAMGAPTATLAGELGYGLQLPRGLPATAYLPTLEAYRAARRKHGHGAGDERVAIARCVYVGADDATALREVGPSIQVFYKASKQYTAGDPVPSVPELIERLHFIVGGPEHCACAIATLGEATGLTHLSVQPTWQGLDYDLATASLRRFGESVLPRLR